MSANVASFQSDFKKHNMQNHSKALPAGDNIYIDIKVNNTTSSREVPARYEQQRLESLVDNPSNYYLTLARWKIPGLTLPILIFPVPDNTNEDFTQYSVTLETSTDIQQVFLFYTSYNVPNSGTPNTFLGTGGPSNSYYWVYNYQHMVEMVNNALVIAHDRLAGKPPGSVPPYLTYDPTTRLFSLFATLPDYEVDTTPTPLSPSSPTTQPTFDADIKIYFNYKLYTLFNGLPRRLVAENSPEVTDGRDVQILVRDYLNTGSTDPIEVIQEFTSLTYWRAVKQIVFITNIIPINPEYTAVSGNSFQKILTDFEPLESSQNDIEATLQYFAEGQYRLTDLVGTNPLFSIDLRAQWLDIYGNQYDIEVSPFQQFTAKLLFIKRNLYKTDNLIYEQ